MRYALLSGNRAVARAHTREAAFRTSRRRIHAHDRILVIANRAGASAKDEIAGYMTKFLNMLDAPGESPRVVIRDNIGARWLGRDVWTSKDPDTTTIELQREILGHSRTLERVIAHEIIHHVDAIRMTEADRALIKIGIKPESHGASFRAGAAKINAVMGDGFVTAMSDQEYVQAAETSRAYFVLIVPIPGGQLGYAWITRLTSGVTEWVNRKLLEGARIVQTRDPRWTSGVKIKKYGGVSLPRKPEDQAKLRALYDSVAERVQARQVEASHFPLA
jgi:hypothetical protein